MHFSLKCVVLQNFSLASSVTVFSWHKPAMSLSAQAGGGADGGGLGGGGADGGCPSHRPQVFLHRCFFSSVYLFLHFLFLQVSLSLSAHGGGAGGEGGGGLGEKGLGGGGNGEKVAAMPIRTSALELACFLAFKSG